MSDEPCGCIKCQRERRSILPPGGFISVPGWRYVCEVCGNKRCPHHTDHELACTDSNEPGQKGSIWE